MWAFFRKLKISFWNVWRKKLQPFYQFGEIMDQWPRYGVQSVNLDGLIGWGK
jgi:hypothetical protein